MYDKAAPKNAIDAHQVVKPSAYTAKTIQLPSPEEIPHLDLEVISLHRLVLGTLHAKFCVVDRKVAAVMSNNMEDNDNVEMMIHVEGPIVDSLYDTALITWSKELNPPLPSSGSPATQGGLPTSGQEPLYTDRQAARGQDQIAADGQAAQLPEHTPEDPHWDVDIRSEITRMQSCYSTRENESRLQAANRQLNLAVKNKIDPTGPEIPDGEEMTPYIDTMTTTPIPMALVSRPPYGPVGKENLNVPQNEAWLSCIRNAQRTIFIQTPDLNAAPLIPALSAALKRGVQVTYYVCFGYNDAGEIIPGQGGTNDQVSQNLVKDLSPAERERLHVCFYVGKDQDHPIHQSFKQRSCHIKLLIADEHVGIQGSGNQDTQSWYHSQEINIMIDSAEVCRKWREGIERNQNTARFGKAAEDGIWRDSEGNPGEGYMGNPGKIEGLIKGVSGMMKKMKDKGGF
jgi:phosphatidylserine/phosphatidylglycerophosphate/cardiolipin synthase-like enzyme